MIVADLAPGENQLTGDVGRAPGGGPVLEEGQVQDGGRGLAEGLGLCSFIVYCIYCVFKTISLEIERVDWQKKLNDPDYMSNSVFSKKSWNFELVTL